MIHLAEVMDLLEVVLLDAWPLKFAALQSTLNPYRVHAVFVIGVQVLFGWQVGQEHESGC